MIEVKIVEDSISLTKARLTTFQLRYPRFIHAEFMTHRLFSRNASSSRAIPVRKILDSIQTDPAMPVHWGKNQKGMQANEEVDEASAKIAQAIWLGARDKVVECVEELMELGVHKQITNRLLEPWSHISVVCTATEFDNFFSLRCHPDAMPEIQALAEQMRDLYFSNTPRNLKLGQWHLPYIKSEELNPGGYFSTASDFPYNLPDLIKASIARCARVSYLTHDKKEPNIDTDIVLYQRLFDSKHMSPFENVATPNVDPTVWSGNFKGWIQLRKTLKGEHCFHYTPPEK